MTIQKNIPIPDKELSLPIESSYPHVCERMMVNMDVGDSVFIRYDDNYEYAKEVKEADSLISVMYQYGYRFKKMVVSENDVIGTRIWKTAQTSNYKY